MGSFSNFNESFPGLLECRNKKGKQMLIVGDFNIEILDPNNKDTMMYSDLCETHHLDSKIKIPTRVTETSSICLDHVLFPNVKDDECSASVVVTELSDHYGQIIEYKIRGGDTEREDTTETLRMMTVRNIEIEKFKGKSKAENRESIYQAKSVEQRTVAFHEILIKNY